ncbi:BsuPI-related putative proteinase inhibitor [Caldibacillus lycopersici]|uniref:Intracellular proteinase inhibitor BsuPI domain-containing protein n=1 Tax=Perspicuibacillus lycopersici TaxID=1325689 RepID=A0AAE3IY44_9BACI|nr:BsuPI-related putative proteinase inhibitor [Perspicuibacillus lycopersici]MCU9615074.1 BsuPI-related putative proteinase inhibitor [Perspicuibacillus lycopersici]
MKKQIWKNFLIILIVTSITSACSQGLATESKNGNQAVESEEGNVKKDIVNKLTLNKTSLKDKKFNKNEIKLEEGTFQPTLQLSKTDHAIAIDFTAENTSGNPITLSFTSGQEYDFLVYNGNNELVYQWSKGRMFLQVIKEVTLENGDKINYKNTWNFVDNEGNVLPDGEYRIEFTVTAQVKSAEGKTIKTNELTAATEINTKK